MALSVLEDHIFDLQRERKEIKKVPILVFVLLLLLHRTKCANLAFQLRPIWHGSAQFTIAFVTVADHADTR